MMDPKEWLKNIAEGLIQDAETVRTRAAIIEHRASEVNRVLAHLSAIAAEPAPVEEPRDEMKREWLRPELVIDVQEHRDAAYQNGWNDGYAEGYGKAKSEAALAAPSAEVERLQQTVKRLLRELEIADAEVARLTAAPSAEVEITDAMVERAVRVFRDEWHGNSTEQLRAIIRAALNPPQGGPIDWEGMVIRASLNPSQRGE